jgi:hypothetical protein
MKQATLKFPPEEAKGIAKFLAEQGAVTQLSWMQDDGLFSKSIICIVAVANDKAELFEAKMQKWIQA